MVITAVCIRKQLSYKIVKHFDFVLSLLIEIYFSEPIMR